MSAEGDQMQLDLFDVACDADVEDAADDSPMDSQELQLREAALFDDFASASSSDYPMIEFGSTPERHNRRRSQNSLNNLQRGGGSRQLRRSDSRGDGSDDEPDMVVAALAAEEGGGGELTAHGKRMREEHEGWSNSRDAMGGQWLRTSALRHAHAQQLRDMELETVQQRAGGDWKFHRCGEGHEPCWLSKQRLDAAGGDPKQPCDAYKAAFTAASPPPHDGTVLRSLVEVVYVSHSCRHRLFVPVWHCKDCKESFSASPLRAGCWPTRFEDARTWIAEGVLEDCRRLVMKGGLSFTRAVEWINLKQEALVSVVPEGSGDGPGPHARLTAHTCFGAFMAYQRATAGRSSLVTLVGDEKMQDDPLSSCGVCAELPPGAAVCTDYKKSLCMDACTKAGHYRNCGKSTRDLASQMGIHYGTADKQVADLHAGGNLELSVLAPDKPGAAAPAAAAAAGPALPQEQEDACESELRCARPEVPRKPAGVDVCGVLGTVCAHGFPVKDGMVDLRTYESYSYYLVALYILLMKILGVRDVFVDFACKLRATWARCVAHLVAMGVLDAAQAAYFTSIRLVVNWMHAEGHNLACQLTASGRHSQGAGRRHGEGAEQLWAILKPIAGLVRYMTHANRRDFLDAHWLLVAEEKMAGLASLLLTRQQKNEALDVELRADRAEIERDAAAKGINLEEARAKFLERVGKKKARDLMSEAELKMEYVETLLQQTAEIELAIVGPRLGPLAPASVSELFKNAPAEGSLTRKKVDLERRLRISAERGSWTPDDADFKEALQQLVDRKLLEHMVQLQDLALENKQLMRQRDEQGAACKEAKGLADRIKARRKKMSKIINQMNLWHRQLPGNSRATLLGEATVDAVLEEGVLSGVDKVWLGVSEQIRIGKRYHLVASDLERCAEERVILKQEVERLSAWVKHMQRCCVERMAALGAEGGVPVVHMPAEGPSKRATGVIEAFVVNSARSSGVAFHLRRHMLSLQKMEAQLPKA